MTRMTVLVAALSLVATLTTPALAGAPSARTDDSDERYIVTLVESANPRSVASEYANHGARIDHIYTAALNGFAGRMSSQAVARLHSDRRVVRVEEDGVVATTGHVEGTTNQTNATWGIDRIDHRELNLDGTYEYLDTGTGVHAYIIDTGIRATHNEFTGRIARGYTSINDGRGTSDCNGHGTHVAGTVGGTLYGAAKSVTLSPVRVLNCNGSGTVSGVIAGVDWVTKNHVKPAVANMSLGGPASTSLDDAVRSSAAAGVTYVVAAGNDGLDACLSSPARVAEALTVAATNSTDTRAAWSNFGSCVDIFAPGVSITSAWHNSDSSTNTISGTSMAAPHVAGVAALYLQRNNGASAATVKSAIEDNATPGVVGLAGLGSPNRMLYSIFEGASDGGGSGGGDDGGTSPAPAASFSYKCGGNSSTCDFDASSSTGSLVSYDWSGAFTGSGQQVTHTFSDPGEHTVTLTVTDEAGVTDETTQRVNCTLNRRGNREVLVCK